MNRQISIFIIFLTLLNACSTINRHKANIDDTFIEQIMFTSKRDGNFEVYVMNADSTEVKRLTDNPKTDYGQNWSPDGNFILFYSDRNGNEEIWRMNNDGTNLINLTNSPSSERNAAYSPDGKSIVFTSDRDNKSKDLYLMDSDGNNVKRLTYNKIYCESPIWTKDGQHIIFTLLVQKDSTDRNFNGEIYIVDVNGENQKRLTYKEGFDSGADISSDGKQIAFYGRSEKGFVDIYIMNIDGSEMINITDNEIEDYSPSWSPDNNWISFTSGNSENYDIWKMNVQTKLKVRLTTQPTRDETPYYKQKIKKTATNKL